MASINKQGKNNKTSYKTVLKWEKEFNKTYICNLEGKDVVRFCWTLCAKWERLICTIKNFSYNYIGPVSTSLKKDSIKSHCLLEPNNRSCKINNEK